MFESRKEPEGYGEAELDEDSEDEKVIEQLETANNICNDFYDMYNGEALEYYLGFGQDMSSLIGQFDDGDSDTEDPDGDDNDDKDDEAKEKKKKKKK